MCVCVYADIDQALDLFNELREQDPFRIENMDTFSNLLYVRVRKLSYLFHVRLHSVYHKAHSGNSTCSFIMLLRFSQT